MNDNGPKLREVRDPHQMLAEARELADAVPGARSHKAAHAIVDVLEAEATALDFIAERVTALELRIGGLTRGDSHGDRPASAPARAREDV